MNAANLAKNLDKQFVNRCQSWRFVKIFLAFPVKETQAIWFTVFLPILADQIEKSAKFTAPAQISEDAWVNPDWRVFASFPI